MSRQSSIAVDTQQQNWQACAQWLNDCGVLPESLRARFKLNTLTIRDLTLGLRDGVVLCNLANVLSPGSVDSSKVCRRQASRMTSIRNIKLFLDACRNEFALSTLFQADMLYNEDIACVIETLSELSKTRLAEQKTGRPGFNIVTNSNEFDSYYDLNNYYNMSGAAGGESFSVDDDDPCYTPYGVILNDQDDDIYQTIMHQNRDSNSHDGSNVSLTKRDHLTKEIFDTETSYVKTLKMIINNFYTPLKLKLSENDVKIIFINIQTLKELHEKLLADLTNAIRGGHGRTSRVCKVYESYKHQMMRDYVDYFAGVVTAVSKVDALCAKNSSFRQELEECRRKNQAEGQQQFRLPDLLRIPYQRVLKYHLFFAQFNKEIDKNHLAKKEIEQTLSSMHDLAGYLNEAQRDKEIIDQIEDLQMHIKDFQAYIQSTGATTNKQQQSTLKDFGHLIKDDSLRIKEPGDRFAKTRSILLFDKAILICKSRNEDYYYKGTLLLHQYKLEESNNDSNNIVGPFNQPSFCLYNINDRNKVYTFQVKDQKAKIQWKAAIADSIDRLMPRGYNNNNHNFVLYNFDRDLVYCNHCNKVLIGVLYQGYKCTKCSSLAHKSCITKFGACVDNSGRNSVSQQQQQQQQMLPRSSISSPTTNELIPFPQTHKSRLPFRVRAVFLYNGKPPVPPVMDSECKPLCFKPKDLIQVTDDDDDEWWKGFRVGNTSNVEGYFPKSYVELIETYIDKRISGSSLNNSIGSTITTDNSEQMDIETLECQRWYVSCERNAAELILQRVSNAQEAVFLVRPRAEGGYAISIKYNQQMQHIRIHVLRYNKSDGTEAANFCLVEQNQFPTINELISYYMMHTLEDNFPQLTSTLGTPYRDLLPAPTSYAIAMHDYDPRRMSTGVEIELKKGERYAVLSKENLGWWRVYNSDGLIGYAPGQYLKEILKETN